ncbi:MAG: orotate phosphoribosyltransferase [Patescibacteria group bacterium]
MPQKSQIDLSKASAGEVLLKIGAVSFSFNPPYTYTSGLKGPMYFDNRIILSYPEARTRIVDLYIEAIKKDIPLKEIDCISATATAAISQGALVADRLKLPMVYVRPSTKSYGKGQKIEGYLKPNTNVLVVEDHVSTGASMINNVLTIRGAGCKVKYCITTTTLENKMAEELVKEHNVKLIRLATSREIMAIGQKHGYISKAERDAVEAWIKDPEQWDLTI